jgi:conjugal transfer pilus assembly protein TraW
MKRILCLCLLSIASTIFAKDLGSVGHTFPVQERSFLEVIYERIHQYQAGVEPHLFEQSIQKRVAAHIVRPQPLGLVPAEKTQHFYYDPSITLSTDLRTPDGHLIARQGTRINALETLPAYQPVWVFVNFDDPKQRTFAVTHLKQYPDAHWILTGGNILEAERALQVTIYFDQLGRLTQQLHIQHVPAVVVREGVRLKITEVALVGDH